jgi:hypothetical protein
LFGNKPAAAVPPPAPEIVVPLWAPARRAVEPPPRPTAEPLLLHTPEPASRPAAARAHFYILRTGHGRMLVAGAPRVDMADTARADDALLLMIPDANRQLAFLFAPDLHPIEVGADGLCAPVISAFRIATEKPGEVRLRHPLSPARYLGVTPAGVAAPGGIVTFDTAGRGPLDCFTLQAVEAASLGEATKLAAAEICAAVARPFRAAPLLQRLRAGQLRPALMEPLLRVLPRDELGEVARLLEDGANLEALRAACGDNPWFARVLPELAAWRARRGPVSDTGVMRSPAEDEFAADPMEGHGQVQAGMAVTALARGRVLPRQGACLLTTVRNEAAYFIEWLAYHRSIGFEHAFIYTNDNLDGSDALLECLAGHGVITLVHNQAGLHCGPQYKMHAHALNLLPQILDYRWAAIIDADEFIAYDAARFSGFDDYLAWQETQPVDAVALCWRMFAARADAVWRDEPTIRRFTRCEPHANFHVKSVFRPNRFWHAQAHYPHASMGQPVVVRSEDGGLHHHAGVADRDPAFSGSPTDTLAWVNHYWMRTSPELLWKMARGHPDWKDQPRVRHLEMAKFLFSNFVIMAGRQDFVEDRRILACAGGLDTEMARLRALPGVADIEARCRADFAARLPHMVRAFIEGAPADGDEPPEFAPFRAVLQQEGGGVVRSTQSRDAPRPRRAGPEPFT